MLFGTFKNTADLLWERYQHIIDNKEKYNVTLNTPTIHITHKKVDNDTVDYKTTDNYYLIMDAAISCWGVSMKALTSTEMSTVEFITLYEGILQNADMQTIKKVMPYRNNPHTMDYKTQNFWGPPYECFPNWGLGDLTKYYLDKNCFFKKINCWTTPA